MALLNSQDLCILIQSLAQQGPCLKNTETSGIKSGRRQRSPE